MERRPKLFVRDSEARLSDRNGYFVASTPDYHPDYYQLSLRDDSRTCLPVYDQFNRCTDARWPIGPDKYAVFREVQKSCPRPTLFLRDVPKPKVHNQRESIPSSAINADYRHILLRDRWFVLVSHTAPSS